VNGAFASKPSVFPWEPATNHPQLTSNSLHNHQWHELQLPPLQLEHPEEEAEDVYFPLLLKLQEEMTLSTFFPLQSGQHTVGSLPKTRHSKSFWHFLQ
jgi:hypothetical protein